LKPLAPSPAWTLVTPYCKRTRPGCGTNTKAAGSPPLSRWCPATSLPPFALGLALDPSGLGHAATLTRRPRDPPVSKHRHKCTEIELNLWISLQMWPASVDDLNLCALSSHGHNRRSGVSDKDTPAKSASSCSNSLASTVERRGQMQGRGPRFPCVGRASKALAWRPQEAP
jgi:hypothetical protein